MPLLARLVGTLRGAPAPDRTPLLDGLRALERDLARTQLRLAKDHEPAERPALVEGGFTARVAALSRGQAIAIEPPEPTAPQELAQPATAATFWGEHDCPSARARARDETLTIDHQGCISCGTCQEYNEDVFLLDDDMGHARVIAQEGNMLWVQDAIDACPVMVISWEA